LCKKPSRARPRARRSVIGPQQDFLVRCEARAWSLNCSLPPLTDSSDGQPFNPLGDNSAEAEERARHVTEAMVLRCKAWAAVLAGGSEQSGVGAGGETEARKAVGLVGQSGAGAGAGVAVGAGGRGGPPPGGGKVLGLVELRRSSSLGWAGRGR
jgi:hypothetical protein